MFVFYDWLFYTCVHCNEHTSFSTLILGSLSSDHAVVYGDMLPSTSYLHTCALKRLICLQAMRENTKGSFLRIPQITTHSTRRVSVSQRAYTQGDSDVISMPSGFRRHLVGKHLINVFHGSIAYIRLVGKLVIIQTFHKPTDRMLFK